MPGSGCASWTPARSTGILKWGQNSETNSAAYMECLLKWGIIQQRLDAKDLVTNELIGEINAFDPQAVAAEAKSYKPGRRGGASC